MVDLRRVFILSTIGLSLFAAAVFQAVGSSDSPGMRGESEDSFVSAGTLTVLTFSDVETSRPIARQGGVTFGDAWWGAVEEIEVADGLDAEGVPPNTVAVLWFAPVSPEETRISFDDPVQAIAFSVGLDPDLEGPTAVFYDESGFVVGRLPIDVHRDFDDKAQRARFSAPFGLEISSIEFDGADGVVGHFSLDDFTLWGLDAIFANGFESGSTEMWDHTVNPTPTPTPLPPTCDDIIVGEIEWKSDYSVQVGSVTNSHPTALLVHKRTDLDWAYSPLTNMTLVWAQFHKPGGLVIPYGVRRPPIGRSIDILFEPGESAPFSAVWRYDGENLYPGLIDIRFRFEYSGGGSACDFVRAIRGPYPPTITPTPTMTPTWTPIPDPS